jgi:hypothetical protein
MSNKILHLFWLSLLILLATASAEERKECEGESQFYTKLGYKSRTDFMNAEDSAKKVYYKNALAWNDAEYKTKCNEFWNKKLPIQREILKILQNCYKFDYPKNQHELEEDHKDAACNLMKGEIRQGSIKSFFKLVHKLRIFNF